MIEREIKKTLPRVVEYRHYIHAHPELSLNDPVMVAEDFSHYLSKHPGAMFFLGMGEDSPGLHMPQYDFCDEALFNGILFMVSSALEFSCLDAI